MPLLQEGFCGGKSFQFTPPRFKYRSVDDYFVTRHKAYIFDTCARVRGKETGRQNVMTYIGSVCPTTIGDLAFFPPWGIWRAWHLFCARRALARRGQQHFTGITCDRPRGRKLDFGRT